MIKIIAFMLLAGVAHGSDWLTFVKALEIKESGADYSETGDDGKAIGGLQIHFECLADVNTRYGTSYTHEQCRNRAVARNVCLLYLKMLGDRFTEETGEKPDWQFYARCWNGGYAGRHRGATRRYWEDVRAIMRTLTRERSP